MGTRVLGGDTLLSWFPHVARVVHSRTKIDQSSCKYRLKIESKIDQKSIKNRSISLVNRPDIDKLFVAAYVFCKVQIWIACFWGGTLLFLCPYAVFAWTFALATVFFGSAKAHVFATPVMEASTTNICNTLPFGWAGCSQPVALSVCVRSLLAFSAFLAAIWLGLLQKCFSRLIEGAFLSFVYQYKPLALLPQGIFWFAKLYFRHLCFWT